MLYDLIWCITTCYSGTFCWNGVQYIAQVNQSKGEAGMLETRKAYEYALDRIGLDLHSAGLWQEYINYLQLPRPNTPAYRALWSSTAAPGQEEAQRVMTLRFCLCLSACRHPQQCSLAVQWLEAIFMGRLSPVIVPQLPKWPITAAFLGGAALCCSA